MRSCERVQGDYSTSSISLSRTSVLCWEREKDKRHIARALNIWNQAADDDSASTGTAAAGIAQSWLTPWGSFRNVRSAPRWQKGCSKWDVTSVLMVLSDLRRPVSRCRLLWLASRPKLAPVKPSFAMLSCLHHKDRRGGAQISTASPCKARGDGQWVRWLEICEKWH